MKSFYLVAVSLTFCLISSTSPRRIWSQCDSSKSCSCGTDVSWTVKCTDDLLWIQPCSCIYYDRKENQSIVGKCLSSCFHFRESDTGSTYYAVNRYLVENASLFNTEMCNVIPGLNREGRFCGRCKKNYGLPVYSYQYLHCIPCENYGYKSWLKYFGISLLPLTVFYMLVIFFKLTITSSHLSGIIFVIQCVLSPIQLKILTGALINSIYANTVTETQFTPLRILLSLSGVVNLDFFRSFISTICLHPNVNIMHVVSLDFIVALYPFGLIFLTYALIRKYDGGCCVIVWMWKPFQWFLKHCNVEIHERTSLVETFATFILLSNVKILGVCVDLLYGAAVYGETGKQLSHRFLYYDANIEYFGPEHIPFAVLALCIGFVFVVLPFFLLLLYPCRCFHRCLNFMGYRGQALHVFMDAFQGNYKLKPYDLRYFSAYYLLLRFLLLLLPMFFPMLLLLPVYSIVIIIGASVFAAFQPYKKACHNKWNIVCMLLLGCFYLSFTVDILASSVYSYWIPVSSCIIISSVISLFCAYVIGLFWGSRIYKKMKQLFSALRRKYKYRNYEEIADFNDLPERV